MSLNFIQLNKMSCYQCNKDRFTIFKSYNTLIAVYDWKFGTMYKDKDFYSITTSKQYTKWCREFLRIDNHDKDFIKNKLILCEDKKIEELVELIDKYGNATNIINDVIKYK